MTRTLQPTSNNQKESVLALIPDYVPAEVYLENLAFFTPSSKRIKGLYIKSKVLKEEVAPDGTRKQLVVKISANHELGLPITSDLDYYRALLKILDEIVEHSQDFLGHIEIPSKRLSDLAGKTWSIKTHREVRDWFARMKHTGIRGAVYNAEHKKYETSPKGMELSVFDEVIYRGEEMNGRIAETNYIKLSGWFVRNYLNHYVRPVDLNFHRRLRKPLAKSLYSLLETGWYATKGKAYTKNYRDLCNEFLIPEYRDLSRIKQQLEPAFRELQKEHFLKDWRYVIAKGDKGRYVMTYYAGEKFFQDQKARVVRRELALLITKAGDKPKQLSSGKKNVSYLVDQILEVTGDIRSRNYYTKVANELSEDTIWMLISQTRQSSKMGEIRTTAAAFFTDLAQRALVKAREHKNQLTIFNPDSKK